MKDLIKYKSPFSAWLDRKQPLPSRFLEKDFVDAVPKRGDNWDCFLALEECWPLYRANDLKWESLKESIEDTKIFLQNAATSISGLEGGWLDSEEKIMIESNVECKPPKQCLPIYIMTIKNAVEERVVYIGKTSSNNRFSNGHTAALKLHNPKYKAYDKKLYRCSVWFFLQEEYACLEWLKPENIAYEVLDSIESHLIWCAQPELNTDKMKQNQSKWNFFIHIQNFTNESPLLNNVFAAGIKNSIKQPSNRQEHSNSTIY